MTTDDRQSEGLETPSTTPEDELRQRAVGRLRKPALIRSGGR